MDRLRFVLGAIIGGVLGLWLWGVVGMFVGAAVVGLLFAVLAVANSRKAKESWDSPIPGKPWGEGKDTTAQNSGGKTGLPAASAKENFMLVAGIIIVALLLYSCSGASDERTYSARDHAIELISERQGVSKNVAAEILDRIMRGQF